MLKQLLAAVFILAAHCGARIQAASPRPNVLFVAVDDLRPELGCYGAAHIKSPHIDRLARESTVFERAYCQVAVCNPSRASVLSGARPATTGVLDNQHFLRPQMPDVVTLPQYFKQQGYEAISLGKIFHHSEREPGDDVQSWSQPAWYHGEPYRHWFTPEVEEQLKKLKALPLDQRPKLIRGPPFESFAAPDDDYPDGMTALKAMETLRQVKDKPFFLAVGFIKPHLPFTCPQKYWDLYPESSIKLTENGNRPQDAPLPAFNTSTELRSYGTVPPLMKLDETMARQLVRGYRACVSFMDAQVGRVLAELDRLGLRENTIVVLWGDHGYHLGEQDLWTKMTNFELGTRVPLIVRVPGQTSGQRSPALVELVDLYPSLAELCGLTLPPHLEGTSFVPLLQDPARPWKTAAFSEYLREGRTKYRGRSIRTDRWRYTEWQDPQGLPAGKELYDYHESPVEKVNLVALPEHAGQAAKMASLLQAGWRAALPPDSTAAHPAPKRAGSRAPFRMLYNSDTTHILTCTSVWRPDRGPLRESMFLSAVDEAAAAGVDAYVMAPGLGWVPWWPSKVLPLEEHAAWFRQRFHLPKAATSFTSHVLNGGDFIKLSVDRCHEKGMACLLSFRLNDVHHKDSADSPGNSHIATVPRFYTDHPEYRLGEQPRDTQLSWARHVQNWAIPEVREFKFRLIEELCRNYDIDGIELDFYRAAAYFRAGETTLGQRTGIMSQFVGRVRKALDDHARPGRRRWLSVRIPSLQAAHGALGIDVAAFAAAGVDMFNLSASYHAEQVTSLPDIRQKVPDAALYLELTHVVSFNGDTSARSHRRATPEFLATTGHLAYCRGADGLSLFNFQYYRDYRDPGQKDADGPYSEPPFSLIRELKDPALLSIRPQHYFIGSVYKTDPRRAYPFPRKSRAGEAVKVVLDLAPPQGGWKHVGRLRLQSKQAVAPDIVWRASLNDVPLAATLDVSEAYPSAFTQMHGQPEEWRAWVVPPTVLKDGTNEVVFTRTGGPPAELVGLDLALPGQEPTAPQRPASE